MPGFDMVEYNNLDALEKQLITNDGNTCAYMMEPIQGEAHYHYH